MKIRERERILLYQEHESRTIRQIKSSRFVIRYENLIKTETRIVEKVRAYELSGRFSNGSGAKLD